MENMNNMFINIGRQQRLTRKYLGIILLTVSTILSIMMIINKLHIVFSIAVFLLYMFGILLMFESRDAVCLGVAIRNREGMSGRFSLGDNFIQDNERSQNIRKIVKNLTFRSFLYSIAITSIVIIIWIL